MKLFALSNRSERPGQWINPYDIHLNLGKVESGVTYISGKSRLDVSKYKVLAISLKSPWLAKNSAVFRLIVELQKSEGDWH